MCKVKRFVAALMICILTLNNSVQVQASAVVVPASIALAEVVKNLLISAGVVYLGYQGVNVAEDVKESLGAALEADATVSSALSAARRWEETDGSSALAPGYTYEDVNFRIVQGGKGNSNNDDNNDDDDGISLGTAITLGLSARLLMAAVNVAKKWLNSAANKYDGVWMDPDIPNRISGSYSKNIDYEAVSIISVDSLESIDAYFSFSGVYDYLLNKGFDDKNCSVIAYKPVGVAVYFIAVPHGYTVLTVEGVGNYLISSSSFQSLLGFSGEKSGSEFLSSIVNSSGCLSINDYCFMYNFASKTISPCSFSIKPGNRNFLYSFNLKTGINKGSRVRYLDKISDYNIKLVDITYDITADKIVCDDSKAPELPDSGFVDFGLTEDDLTSGLDYPDLKDLIEYVKKLIESIKNNPGGLTTAQAESVLEGINKITFGVSGIADILGEILASILQIPQAFAKIFLDADGLINLINSVPDAIGNKLIEIFPNSKAVGDAIISVPDAIIDGLKNVTVEIPDITIPEIKIPEIVVPEPKVDVKVEPLITINNDFDGLADRIAQGIKGILVELFVPDYDLTCQKFGEVRSYFGFVDDVSLAVGGFKTKVFGITPVPYLKIPLGSETSKYNYGFGEYWIIDISWYSAYKSYGDKIILAIMWALFLWHIFIKLPGIISGAEGQIMSGVRTYHKATGGTNKSSKSNKG